MTRLTNCTTEHTPAEPRNGYRRQPLALVVFVVALFVVVFSVSLGTGFFLVGLVGFGFPFSVGVVVVMLVVPTVFVVGAAVAAAVVAARAVLTLAARAALCSRWWRVWKWHLWSFPQMGRPGG